MLFFRLIPILSFIFFYKSKAFFMWFRIQFYFQILTLEIEKYRFKQKSEDCFLGENGIFDQKLRFLLLFLNYSVEAEKLIFPTKWVVLAPKQLAKFFTD